MSDTEKRTDPTSQPYRVGRYDPTGTADLDAAALELALANLSAGGWLALPSGVEALLVFPK